MSALEEQIKKLQRKKQKADLYRTVIKNLESELTNPDAKEYNGLLEEVTKEISSFCSKQINVIESVDSTPKLASKPAVKVAKTAPSDADEEGEPAKQDPYQPEEEIADPLRFMVRYRNMEGQACIVLDAKGERINAKIKGVRFPNLFLETENGASFTAPPKDIIFLNNKEGETNGKKENSNA